MDIQVQSGHRKLIYESFPVADPPTPNIKKRKTGQSKPRTAALNNHSYTAKGDQMDTDHLIFGPGPNEKGVWKYFHRDVSRRFGQCQIDGCGKIVGTPNGSTTGLRFHLARTHMIELKSNV